MFTLRTNKFNINKMYILLTKFIYVFAFFSEQTSIISL
jgi:hypothetical protein